MKTRKLILLAALLAFLASCSNSPMDIELQYANTKESVLNYELSYMQDSKAEMNGEPMTAEYHVNIPYEIRSSQKGTMVESNILIQNPNVKFIIPGGQQVVDTRNLKNLEIGFTHTPFGYQKEIILIDSLQIDFGAMLGGTLDWDYLFTYITPGLPGKKSNVGDTWNETITVNRIEAGSKITADLELKHELSGFEKFNGRKCAVIESEISAILNDSYSMMDASWNLTGTLSGNMTWYFDYEQGRIIQLLIEERSEGSVVAPEVGINATYSQNSIIELKHNN